MNHLTQKDIDFLRKTHGPMFDSAADALKVASRPLIIVGDGSSVNALRAGGKPDLLIYDMRERREVISQEALDTIIGFAAEEVVARNPKGQVTNDLLDAVKYALAHMPKRIRVVGEEDLAGLVALFLAPVGASVMYGLEGKLTVVKVTTELKEKARGIISRLGHKLP